MSRIWKFLPLAAVCGICGRYYYLYRAGRSGLHPLTQPREGQIKIACVGDSITYGHGTTHWPDNTYPAKLRRNLGSGYHVNNFGFNGKSVTPDSGDAYVRTPLYGKSLAYGCDILVFMMGSNDAKPQNWHSTGQFRQELEQLLDSYGNPSCILCTPATAFLREGLTGELAEYDIQPTVVAQIAATIREVAVSRGCTLVDIHALTQSHPEWYTSDGIHPNNAGAEAIAAAIAAAIQRSVKK